MLNLNLEDVMVEFKDGAIKNVGPANKRATAKLFDVTDVTVREFGDRRVKIVATDESGNEVQIALFPDDIEAVGAAIEDLEAESSIFE